MGSNTAVLRVALLDQIWKTWKLAEGMCRQREVVWPWPPVTEARTVAAGSVRHDVVSTYCGVVQAWYD